MGRPNLYRVEASWQLHGDDRDVEYEQQWIEEQLAIHNVEDALVTFQRVIPLADRELSNSDGWDER